MIVCQLGGRKHIWPKILHVIWSFVSCEATLLHLEEVHLQRKGLRPECRISYLVLHIFFSVILCIINVTIYPLTKEISMCHHIVSYLIVSFLTEKYFCTRNGRVMCVFNCLCLQANQFLIQVWHFESVCVCDLAC